MHSFVLQEWVQVTGDHSGSATVSSITQDGSQWLDLEGYQDLGFWFDCSAVTGAGVTVTINFETSPTREDALFQAMRSFPFTAGAAGTGGRSALAANIGSSVAAGQTSVPLARWVRWRLSSSATSAWSMTFRILVTGTTYQ